MQLRYEQWAVRLWDADGRQLAMLAQFGGIQASLPSPGNTWTVNEPLWLQGDFATLADGSLRQHLARQLLCLNHAEVFGITDEQWLVPLGKRLPTDRLPQLDWRPLRELLHFELPVASIVGGSVRPVGLKLVRGPSRFQHSGVSPTMWLGSLDTLLKWVGDSPLQSFVNLEFACDGSGLAAVKGERLPALPGARYCVFGSVAIPLGWHWQPEFTPETVNQLFGMEDGALAIWLEDDSWQEIPCGGFLPLGRGSVRMTAARLISENRRK